MSFELRAAETVQTDERERERELSDVSDLTVVVTIVRRIVRLLFRDVHSINVSSLLPRASKFGSQTVSKKRTRCTVWTSKKQGAQFEPPKQGA